MGLLLFLVGSLALVSGGVKLWRRSRRASGAAGAAVAETVLGAFTVLAAGVGLARVRPAAWTLVALVLVVVALSLAAEMRRVLGERDRREASEGERLRRYVERRATGPR